VSFFSTQKVLSLKGKSTFSLIDATDGARVLALPKPDGLAENGVDQKKRE
jgi:hypothetical protein